MRAMLAIPYMVMYSSVRNCEERHVPSVSRSFEIQNLVPDNCNNFKLASPPRRKLAAASRCRRQAGETSFCVGHYRQPFAHLIEGVPQYARRVLAQDEHRVRNGCAATGRTVSVADFGALDMGMAVSVTYGMWSPLLIPHGGWTSNPGAPHTLRARRI